MTRQVVTESSPLVTEIKELLKAKGEMTRGRMVQELGYPRTTIYDNIKFLMIHGEVETRVYHIEGAGRGRPKVYFRYVGK